MNVGTAVEGTEGISWQWGSSLNLIHPAKQGMLANFKLREAWLCTLTVWAKFTLLPRGDCA